MKYLFFGHHQFHPGPGGAGRRVGGRTDRRQCQRLWGAAELPAEEHPIQVYYSTKYFELIPGYDKDSLYPDQPVAQTYADYVAGGDPEVQAVLGQQ